MFFYEGTKMCAGYIRLITLRNEHVVIRTFIQLRYRELSTLGTAAMYTEYLPKRLHLNPRPSFPFELLQCVHARCHHARISCSFIHFNTFKAHPAKTRTFQSILLVAMTHLIFPPPPLSSFFTMPLTNPLESPFDVGPIGTSGAHRMLLTKCP